MVDIVTLAGKGSALTYDELDANFENLNAGVLSVENTLATQQATIAATLAEAQTLTATAQGAAALAEAAADSAASVMQQDLSVIDQTFITSANLVDIKLDWDGRLVPYNGWRERCSHASWENEPLCGNWLGSAANEAAARAISGATTGSYYYDTTAAVFRKLNAGAGVSEVWRGNARKYPAQRLVTAESNRVVIWDLTQAGAPMWMVFVAGVTNYLNTTYGIPKAVEAVDSLLLIACSAVNYGYLAAISFTADRMERWQEPAAWGGVGRTRYSLPISGRNSANSQQTLSATGLVKDTCNDVAAVVLPGAPVDIATGLPVPTIAVATNGGVSVIKDDGAVWDLTYSTYVFGNVFFTDQNEVGFTSNGSAPGTFSVSILKAGLPTADLAANPNSSTYYRYYESRNGNGVLNILGTGISTDASKVVPGAIGGAAGLTLIHENPATPGNGMVAYITKDYNSGWLPGDIRGAWLADSAAETITGSELVTNGDFASATNWTAGTGWAISGEVATRTGSASGSLSQNVTIVSGKSYVVTFTISGLTGGNVQPTFDGADSGGIFAANGTYTVTLTATAARTSLLFYASGTGTIVIDNVSMRLADIDRSVKGKGLQIFGSLTKAAVASGSQLVGYSGFSAANYLEQPYNSDLDFGTGDFCIFGWLKEAPNSTTECVFGRGAYSGLYSGAGLALSVNSSGYLVAGFSDDAFVTQDQVVSTAVVDDSVFRLIWVIRRAGYFELWSNAAKAASDVATSNANTSLSNSAATFRLGEQQDGAPLTNGTLALWRSMAYAPTAEQIAHIYETEKALFEPSAQCCLAGTGNAITALAYDDETDLLHVGTSYGRSAFKGLARVASEATPVGAIRAIAGGAGVIAQAGATGADVGEPAYSLREELTRNADQLARLGQAPVAHDFVATAAQTIFTLPVGWEILEVCAATGAASAARQREGSGKQWTRSFDGFRWSAVFAAGRAESDWISIVARRA